MVCAALRERAVTGVGAHIDISLFDIMCEWMMPLLLAEQLSSRRPEGGPMRCCPAATGSRCSLIRSGSPDEERGHHNRSPPWGADNEKLLASLRQRTRPSTAARHDIPPTATKGDDE
jgi:hypothetical protein